MAAKKRSATQTIAPGAFDDAMRRLVRVPKAEVDAEDRKYKAMRKRLKDKKRTRKKDR
jgi:hypothetical protein